MEPGHWRWRWRWRWSLGWHQRSGRCAGSGYSLGWGRRDSGGGCAGAATLWARYHPVYCARAGGGVSSTGTKPPGPRRYLDRYPARERAEPGTQAWFSQGGGMPQRPVSQTMSCQRRMMVRSIVGGETTYSPPRLASPPTSVSPKRPADGGQPGCFCRFEREEGGHVPDHEAKADSEAMNCRAARRLTPGDVSERCSALRGTSHAGGAVPHPKVPFVQFALRSTYCSISTSRCFLSCFPLKPP